jgi:hypothetical protein
MPLGEDVPRRAGGALETNAAGFICAMEVIAKTIVCLLWLFRSRDENVFNDDRFWMVVNNQLGWLA